MKKKKKKKITIWVCEDDESLWEYQKEVLSEHFPKASVKFFLNAGYAAQVTGSPDFILIDIGGAMNFGCDVVSLQRYNVEGLANLHPGAIFIVNSAIGILAKDVFDELESDVQAITRWCDGCNMSEDICNIIKDYT